jgi:hypothetical protein
VPFRESHTVVCVTTVVDPDEWKLGAVWALEILARRLDVPKSFGAGSLLPDFGISNFGILFYN